MSESVGNYYESHYNNVHYRGSLGLFTKLYHFCLELGRNTRSHFGSVLEIGGGSGEHLAFVQHEFDRFVVSDLTIGSKALENLRSDKRNPKIEFITADATQLPFADDEFNRIISTCVLHHISTLELALGEIRRVSSNGAVIDIYLPCDPGLLYRWLRHLTSHYKQKKIMKLSRSEVKYLWAKEHPNHYLGIVSLLKIVFREDRLKISRYPFFFSSWNFNLFAIVRIQVKK